MNHMGRVAAVFMFRQRAQNKKGERASSRLRSSAMTESDKDIGAEPTLPKIDWFRHSPLRTQI